MDVIKAAVVVARLSTLLWVTAPHATEIIGTFLDMK